MPNPKETRIKDGNLQQFSKNKATPGWSWRTIGTAPEAFNLGNWTTHKLENHIRFHPPSRHSLQAYHKKSINNYKKKTPIHKKSKVMKKKKPPPPIFKARGVTTRNRKEKNKKGVRRTRRRKRNYSRKT